MKLEVISQGSFLDANFETLVGTAHFSKPLPDIIRKYQFYNLGDFRFKNKYYCLLPGVNSVNIYVVKK